MNGLRGKATKWYPRQVFEEKTVNSMRLPMARTRPRCNRKQKRLGVNGQDDTVIQTSEDNRLS